jgi:aspartate/methionine/tyrosine aminotransferase
MAAPKVAELKAGKLKVGGLKVAGRGLVPPFIVMEVMRAANARQAAGGDVLHLEVGQPSSAAPARVIEAARAALSSDVIGYTEALGIPPLRRRIAAHYEENYGVTVDAGRIVVTTGSSGAFLLAFLAAFDAGDRVALAAPGYPAYRNILSALGVEPVSLPAGPATRFQPSPELLDRVEGPLHGLIVASPANPTGTMLDRAELARLAAYCAGRGIRLVSDEIYHGITYGPAATTALAVTDQAVVINSFSKYFSMTGWRLGWMVLPEDLLRPVECLSQNLFISPPTLSQHAAIAAFACRDELDANVARYARNRAVLLEELPKAGLNDLAPADGAFYVYANVARFTNDSEAFCKRMLAETGVAATPGIDFDPARGHTSLRFSFAGATADMVEAARRIKGWLR